MSEMPGSTLVSTTQNVGLLLCGLGVLAPPSGPEPRVRAGTFAPHSVPPHRLPQLQTFSQAIRMQCLQAELVKENRGCLLPPCQASTPGRRNNHPTLVCTAFCGSGRNLAQSHQILSRPRCRQMLIHSCNMRAGSFTKKHSSRSERGHVLTKKNRASWPRRPSKLGVSEPANSVLLFAQGGP